MRCSPILALLLPALALAADPRGPAVPDYPADEVAAGIYVIHGPRDYPTPENQGFMNNPAFVVTDAGVVVVDPGSSVQTGEMVLRQIRRITDRPLLAVLNTHVHGDHWLANQALRAERSDLPIYAHPRMLEAVDAGAGHEWVARMLGATAGATRGTEVVGPNIAVGDGDEVVLGGFTFRFHYFGQVHTLTDLMIEVVEPEVLFLADNATNQRIVRMDDGSFRGSIAALDAARARIPAKVLVPGHGPTGGWEIVDDYREYLAGVYETVAALYEQGVGDFDMKPQVVARLARFSDWAGFNDELGKHISLAYLEAESAAF